MKGEVNRMYNSTETIHVAVDGTVTRGIKVETESARGYGSRGDHDASGFTGHYSNHDDSLFSDGVRCTKVDGWCRDKAHHGEQKLGILCGWNAQTARMLHTPEDNGGIPRDTWVDDPRSEHGVRRTNILAVTLPHDCSNHLPDSDDAPDEPVIADFIEDAA